MEGSASNSDMLSEAVYEYSAIFRL